MNSKRILFLLVTFSAFPTGFCQTSPEVKKQVEYIRKAYQDAQSNANVAKTSEEIRWYIKDWTPLCEIVRENRSDGKIIKEETREISDNYDDVLLTLRRGMSYVEAFNNLENINFE